MAGGDELAVASGKRGVIDREGHLDGRRADLDKRQRLHTVGVADRLADRDVLDAGNTDDVADRGGFGCDALKSVNLIDIDDLSLIGVLVAVIIGDHDLLILPDGAALNASDRDASDIFVVIDGGNEHLQLFLRFAFGSRDVVDDQIQQRR